MKIIDADKLNYHFEEELLDKYKNVLPIQVVKNNNPCMYCANLSKEICPTCHDYFKFSGKKMIEIVKIS